MKLNFKTVLAVAIGWLSGTCAFALDQVDGVYQIASATDLVEFAAVVNGGENLACAVLTADIKCAPDQPMIGTDAKRYAGVFDGDGHTITLDAYPTEDACAVFRYVDYKGTVKNLVVDGQITTAAKYAAAVAAYNRGTVTRCVSKVTINSAIAGDGTHGGLVGIQYMGGILKDCLSLATITGRQWTADETLVQPTIGLSFRNNLGKGWMLDYTLDFSWNRHFPRQDYYPASLSVFARWLATDRLLLSAGFSTPGWAEIFKGVFEVRYLATPNLQLTLQGGLSVGSGIGFVRSTVETNLLAGVSWMIK